MPAHEQMPTPKLAKLYFSMSEWTATADQQEFLTALVGEMAVSQSAG